MDTEGGSDSGKNLEVLQQTYDQTPISLSKYYLGVLLEADHADPEPRQTRSF